MVLQCTVQGGPKVDVLLIVFFTIRPWLKFRDGILTNTGSFRYENYSTFITVHYTSVCVCDVTIAPRIASGSSLRQKPSLQVLLQMH